MPLEAPRCSDDVERSDESEMSGDESMLVIANDLDLDEDRETDLFESVLELGLKL